MKTFTFAPVLRTRENTDVFITLDKNIFGIHSKRVNILYLYLAHLAIYLAREIIGKILLSLIGIASQRQFQLVPHTACLYLPAYKVYRGLFRKKVGVCLCPFVTFFSIKDLSGTTGPRILKVGTNSGYNLLCCVKEKQAC